MIETKEYFLDNVVRISNKDIRIYLGQCDKKLNKYPTVVLSFGETFAEKGRTIANILGAIGIKIHDSNFSEVSGTLRFKSQEDNILNQRTGRREKKIFYQITLAKVEGLNTENIKKYEFADLGESKILKDDVCKNELKISDNVLDFYLGQCNLDFQSYDQLVLSTTFENIEMIKYILKILNPLGIQINEDYIEGEKIYFNSIERERINPKTGRKERKKFYKLGITKVPELFMYTNPEEAIDIGVE